MDVRRLLDNQLVSTGVPGAIVGVAISRLFEQEEWWQFFPLMAVAGGVWVLIKVGSKIAPKVEKSIDQADQLFDQQFDRARVRLSGFQQRYLEALKTHCYNLKVEGYKGRLPRLALEKIYVPLQMDSAIAQKQAIEIWDVLPRVHHQPNTFPERLLAVIAHPGYGKTTLLRFLTLRFSNQTYQERSARELIPVLLLFREIHSRIQSQTEPRLPQLIVNQELAGCGDLPSQAQWFRDQLRKGRCLVMLDGLDEVPKGKRELVSQWANWQMKDYPSQFILTSRPHGYDSSLFDGVRSIEILDFNTSQKQGFIEKWYRFVTWDYDWKLHWEESQRQDANRRLSREQAETESNAQAQKAASDLSRQLFADRNLSDLAKNPLLLTIIAATHEASEQLPKQRIYLYREIFKLLLEYRPNRRDTRLTIPIAEDNQRILQCLAYQLTEAKQTQCSPEQGAAWIAARLAEVRPDQDLSPKAFLDEIQKVSGLLAGGEGDLYEFTHKTFQEYLAAQELMVHPTGKERVMKQFANKDWEEVVYFYAMLTEPVPFVEAAIEMPENTHTLELAHRLAQDSNKVTASLKERLQALRVQQQPQSLEVRLQQRFQNLFEIGEGIAISDYITWGDYELFTVDEGKQLFHSKTALYSDTGGNPTDGVAQIKWEEARWFCGWLALKNLAPDEGVYDYRLPTAAELEAANCHTNAEAMGQSGTAWTTEQKDGRLPFRVVRQRVPDRYGALINYLANGAWKEADQETAELMLMAVGNEAEQRGYLEHDEIRNFPCDDLRLIDQLWVKYSGGKFGFSVQKQLWVEVGGKLDYGKDRGAAKTAFKKMCDRNGWRENNQYISYDDLKFDTNAPKSHLPSLKSHLPSWLIGREMVLGEGFYSSLASRLVNCSR